MLEQIFGIILSLSVTASVMIGIILLIKGLLKVSKRRIRQSAFVFLWMLVFLRMCIPFSIEIGNIFHTEAVNPAEWVYQTVVPEYVLKQQSGVESKNLSDDSENAAVKALLRQQAWNANDEKTESDLSYNERSVNTSDLFVQPVETQQGVAISVSSESNEIKTEREIGWFTVISAIWAIGSIGLILLTIFNYIWTLNQVQTKNNCLPKKEHLFWSVQYALERSNLSRKVSLKFDENGHTAVYGIFRPKVVISEDNVEGIGHILMHEFMHIKHFDNAKKLFVRIVLCLHWMNPLAWIAAALFEKDIEVCCDERVLSALGFEERKAYAFSLLNFAQKRRGLGMNSFASFGAHPVRVRIAHVLNCTGPAKFLPPIGAALAIFLLAGCMTNPAAAVGARLSLTTGNELTSGFVNFAVPFDDTVEFVDYTVSGSNMYIVVNKDDSDEELGYGVAICDLATGRNSVNWFAAENGRAAGKVHRAGNKLYMGVRKDDSSVSLIAYDTRDSTAEFVCNPNIFSGDTLLLSGDEKYLTWYEDSAATGQKNKYLVVWDIVGKKIVARFETNGNQNYSVILDGYVAYQRSNEAGGTELVRYNIQTGEELVVDSILSGSAYSVYGNENYIVYKEAFGPGADIIIYDIAAGESTSLWYRLSLNGKDSYKDGTWGIDLLKDKLILTGGSNTICQVSLKNYSLLSYDGKDPQGTGFYNTKVNQNTITSMQYGAPDMGTYSSSGDSLPEMEDDGDMITAIPLNSIFYGITD